MLTQHQILRLNVTVSASSLIQWVWERMFCLDWQWPIGFHALLAS